VLEAMIFDNLIIRGKTVWLNFFIQQLY